MAAANGGGGGGGAGYETYVHYFPHALRDDAEALLQSTKKGTFLVRPSSRDGALVISLLQASKILHLLILRRGQGFGVDPSAWKNHSLKNETFVSLELLIARLRQLAMLTEGLVRTDLDAAELSGEPMTDDGQNAAAAAAGGFDGGEDPLSSPSIDRLPNAMDVKQMQAAFSAAGDAKDMKAAPAAQPAVAANATASATTLPPAGGAALQRTPSKNGTPAKQAPASTTGAAAAATPIASAAGGAGASDTGATTASAAAIAAAAANDMMGAAGREELKRVLALSEQSAVESEYKGMLQAMLLDGKLGITEVGALTEWRTRHNFSDAQHLKVLASLGLTGDEFDALKRFEPEGTHGGGSSSGDANLCVICLAEPRQTVFIDCGHFACCMHCAALVSMCPLCRSPSTKHIKVFS